MRPSAFRDDAQLARGGGPAVQFFGATPDIAIRLCCAPEAGKTSCRRRHLADNFCNRHGQAVSTSPPSVNNGSEVLSTRWQRVSCCIMTKLPIGNLEEKSDRQSLGFAGRRSSLRVRSRGLPSGTTWVSLMAGAKRKFIAAFAHDDAVGETYWSEPGIG